METTTKNWMILEVYCDSTGTHAWMLSRAANLTVAELKTLMQGEIKNQVTEGKEYTTIDKTSTIWTAGGHEVTVVEVCGDEVHLIGTEYIANEVTRKEVAEMITDWIDSGVDAAESIDNSGE